MSVIGPPMCSEATDSLRWYSSGDAEQDASATLKLIDS